MKTEYYIVRMPPDIPYDIRAELNSWYVESEPIVRCMDCEWFAFDICACKRRPLHMAVEPDGFCAWGRRADG